MFIWIYFAQRQDSVISYREGSLSNEQDYYRIHWVVPAAAIGSGTIIMLETDADEFLLSNLEVREERNEHFIKFSNHAVTFFSMYLQPLHLYSVYLE